MEFIKRCMQQLYYNRLNSDRNQMQNRSRLVFIIISCMIHQQDQLLAPLDRLLDCLTSRNRNLVIGFLEARDMEVIVEAFHCKLRVNAFVRSVYIRLFVQSYLTRTDRSIYIPFYAENSFHKIEFEQLCFLCNHSDPTLVLLAQNFQSLFKRLAHQLQPFQLNHQILQSIRDSLTDPELPFPKLHKQTIGMHCNSAFQYFLVDQHFPSRENGETDEYFQALKNFIVDREQTAYENWEIEIMGEVFRQWGKVNYQNYENFLTGKLTHNLVVLVLALIDLLIECFHTYLQSIQDPLYAFAQFNLRYCIFRNVVLSLEQKLSFVFQTQTILCQTIQNSDRKISLWQCALSKWYSYMHRHHNQCSSIFFYLLKKISLKEVYQQTASQANTGPLFIEIQNRLELRQPQILDRQHHFEVYSPIEDYFDKDTQLYPQLIKQYVEYLMDISVSKNSVHWCGYTKQALYIPFQDFEKQLLQCFETYLQRLIDVGKEVSQGSSAICILVKALVTELDKQYLKPTTLLKIIHIIMSKLDTIIKIDPQQTAQLQQQLVTLRQELQERDRVLEHFNEQIQVQNQVSIADCILIDSCDQDQCLKTSGSTNGTNMDVQLKICEAESDFS